MEYSNRLYEHCSYTPTSKKIRIRAKKYAKVKLSSSSVDTEPFTWYFFKYWTTSAAIMFIASFLAVVSNPLRRFVLLKTFFKNAQQALKNITMILKVVFIFANPECR